MFNFANKIIILIIALFVGVNGIFIVDQRQQALVVRFGEVTRSVTEAGLNYKVPFIDEIKYFDKRILNVLAEEREVLAEDQKRVIVNAFAKYQIIDPLKFFQTVRDIPGANIRILGALESSMRQVIGDRPLSALLSDKRAQIMGDIGELVNKTVLNSGMKLVDVRITRADLPNENSAAIYSRMQSEREKEAREFRAQGNEESQKIKSIADKESRSILADAKKQAEILHGQGDAKGYQIIADAVAQDTEFFKFYRTMQAYEKVLKNENTKMIISPENKFFKMLKQ
jgi:membrane protease subunit HflC